jgi:hypothetical protein
MRPAFRPASILVGVLLYFWPSPAQAEFTLQLRENGVSGNPGFKVSETSPGTFALTTYGNVDVTWTATPGTIHATAAIDGYKFDLYGNSNLRQSPSLGVLSLSAQLTSVNGKATTFSYYVADSPLQIPQTKSGNLYLASSVFTLKDYQAGDAVQAQAHYTVYRAGGNKSYLTDVAGPLTSASRSARTPTLAIDTKGALYGLADLGGVIRMRGGPGTVHFWSQTVTALPEPAGLPVALVGGPCMAVVLVLTRRRAFRVLTVA